ncbi:hypothetical protein BC827DRAFT_1157240 [Russula dissimulans]|nr:hypothetical protein BC827DRAFT_1157240 [Russula dissimulans]
MQPARQRLSALQEELRGIEETEAEMVEIMKHVDALQGILAVQRSSSVESIAQQFEAGARMTLDAILLTIADISLDAKEKLFVAIFPEMQIASGDGVLVKNTVNQFEVWLTGNIDYGSAPMKTRQIVVPLVLEASLDDLMMYTGNRIMLVEAKCDKEMLIDCMPEATSQAITLSEVTGAVRYCLSDGAKWMFQVYTSDAQGNRISYEGPLQSRRHTLRLAKTSRKVYDASWSYCIIG